MLASLLAYEFIRNAFLTGIILGALAPLLGVFLVMRRMALLADTFSHVTLAGVAMGMYFNKTFPQLITVTPIYSGIILTGLASFFTEKLSTLYQNYKELSLPIVMSTGVGISVLFISLADGFNTDLYGYLFGSISAISRSDLYFICILALLVFVTMSILYKELLLLSFDEEYATVTGIKGVFINRVFMLLVAVVIACSIQITGALLVAALMVLPVAAAIRICKSFKQTLIASILLGEFSVIAGIFIAYELNLPPGGTIVLLSLLILLFTIWGTKLRTKLLTSYLVANKEGDSTQFKS